MDKPKAIIVAIDTQIYLQPSSVLFEHAEVLQALFAELGVPSFLALLPAGRADHDGSVNDFDKKVLNLLTPESVKAYQAQQKTKVKKDVVKSKRVKASRPKRVSRNTKTRR